MKNMTMIAAVGKNLELGKNNDLIWHLKEDMKFFREKTMGKPIIMGMKTLESLPKLLPGRKHIVLTTKNPDLDPEIIIVHSIDELLEKVANYPEVMVIGGASVYKQLIDYSDKLLLTEIDASADADVYFPTFNKEEWDREVLGENEENNISYKHLVYTRKK
ncbi:MAG: dihydrofolate reductase [Bacilli bacterium]|nr:dihydrofolate reductase [Bacilli bacterium]